MDKRRNLTLSFLLILSLAQIFGLSGISVNAADHEDTTGVILFIGDGMGPDHVELGRLVEYGPNGDSSILEFPYRTTVSTNSIDLITTDSAASGTAIATGVKTTNGRIGTNFNAKMNLTNIREIAQENGYATGIVATCHLTHATPAAFLAHDEARGHYVAIGEDIARAGADVLLGGGSGDGYLGTQIAEMEADGYTYITNATELQNANTTPLLGLFTNVSLPRADENYNYTVIPSILDMTMKAIELLSNTGKPYFLMVEGSQIDWGGHANSAPYVAMETIEFEKAVKYAQELGESDPNLQILVTADHETGGLSVKNYDFQTALPSTFATEEEQFYARLNRTEEISVGWSTGGHTMTEVYLTGMGPFTEKITSAEHHVDTFSIMREAIDGTTEPEGSGWYKGHIPQLVWIISGGVVLVAAISTSIIFIVKRVKKKRNK